MRLAVLIALTMLCVSCNSIPQRETIEYPKGWPFDFVTVPDGAKPFYSKEWVNLEHPTQPNLNWESDGFTAIATNENSEMRKVEYRILFSSSKSIEELKNYYDELLTSNGVTFDHTKIDRGPRGVNHLYTITGRTSAGKPLKGSLSVISVPDIGSDVFILMATEISAIW
jgi:hypothetical protein